MNNTEDQDYLSNVPPEYLEKLPGLAVARRSKKNPTDAQSLLNQ